MMEFDPAVVGVAVGSDGISGFADAQQVCEAEFRAGLKILIVQAGLEARHDGSAGLHISAELLALSIAENGNVRQQQRTVFADPFKIEAVFVHEVEGEAAAEESFVKAVSCLAHVCMGMSRGRARVEKLRALPDDNSDVCQGAPGLEVSVVFLGPLEIVSADFLP